jgi:hypothetical protein
MPAKPPVRTSCFLIVNFKETKKIFQYLDSVKRKKSSFLIGISLPFLSHNSPDRGLAGKLLPKITLGGYRFRPGGIYN